MADPEIAASDPGVPTARMRELLARIERAGAVPLYRLTPQQARIAYAQRAQVLDFARVELPLDETLDLPARDGSRLSLRRYAAGAADWQRPRPALLYLHGGGFVVGGSHTHDALCRQLAARSGWMVCSLDYRLAPEHPFPAAFDDAWDALVWLREQAGALGVDEQMLAVGGDSAGGTLAVATALAARDAGLPLRRQVLFYPGMGCALDTPSRRQFAHGALLDAELIDWFFALTLRRAADCDDPRFAPLRADLRGLAPVWMAVAGMDPLRDEGLLFAQALRAAGVAVDCRLFAGVTHDFVKMSRALPQASVAVDGAAAALRAAADHCGACTA